MHVPAGNRTVVRYGSRIPQSARESSASWGGMARAPSITECRSALAVDPAIEVADGLHFRELGRLDLHLVLLLHRGGEARLVGRSKTEVLELGVERDGGGLGPGGLLQHRLEVGERGVGHDVLLGR